VLGFCFCVLAAFIIKGKSYWFWCHFRAQVEEIRVAKRQIAIGKKSSSSGQLKIS